jgi:ribosomal protein S1
MSHEPYVFDAMKMYDMYCSTDVMDTISSYETGTYKNIREGVVTNYNEHNDTATIVLSPKHTVQVGVNPKIDTITVGNKIDVVVSRRNGEIVADASSKSAQMERLKQELIKQIQTPTSAYTATIKEIVYNSQNTFNGFIVDVSGLRCFMPGTESDVVPLNDYTTMVGQSMYVMPVAESKDSLVVSHKEYLNTLKPATINRLSEVEKNQLVEGVVSSVKHFGVFILIDKCVPTLLSVSEMNDETETLFKEGKLQIGENISFYIDNINGDRVTITQTVSKSEGWDRLKETVEKSENYMLEGNVKNLFENGVVIISEEFNGITFFLSSKVVNIENLKVGNPVILPVESIDTVKKTVRLRLETEETEK